MPEMLPWLDRNPMIYHVSREGVIGSVIFWMFALAVLYIVLYQRQTAIGDRLAKLVLPLRKAQQSKQ
jgi:hypothetical protein